MAGQMTSDIPESMLGRVRRQIGSIPVIGTGLKSLQKGLHPSQPFRSSPSYWESRYRQGGSSGVGSYGRLARFKAEVINRFVESYGVADIVEFGCGDGAQLTLARYPSYTGFDVSPFVVEQCRSRFASDAGKQFYDLDSRLADTIKAEMAMSLDVIYHLVEDSVYEAYMRRLAHSATRFVCIYSSNANLPGHVPHIRHRNFIDWFARNAPEWAVMKIVPNAYPHDPAIPDETSWADFYFLSRETS